MEIEIKTFPELTIYELYDLLQLRSEVFVVEQDCVYQDIDGKDEKGLHVFGKKDENIVAYTRCFPPGTYFEEAAITRVVVPVDQREYGYGHVIMEASIKAIEKECKSHRKPEESHRSYGNRIARHRTTSPACNQKAWLL